MSSNDVSEKRRMRDEAFIYSAAGASETGAGGRAVVTAKIPRNATHMTNTPNAEKNRTRVVFIDGSSPLGTRVPIDTIRGG